MKEYLTKNKGKRLKCAGCGKLVSPLKLAEGSWLCKSCRKEEIK
jgi:hypothetical protein